MRIADSHKGPLPIPDGWQYGVIRKDDSVYETYVLVSPHGERHELSVNGLDFYSDAGGFLNHIRQWVIDCTSATEPGEPSPTD